MSSNKATDIEIFAGAGGLTLGLERAGFEFAHAFEFDIHTCKTLAQNHVSQGGLLHGEVHQKNVAEVDWSDFSGNVRLLAGGAPCQPFSLAGRHLADKDGRNMFPAVLRAVRSLQPKAIILENVQGLARPSFRPYLDYILRQLRWPSISPHTDEEWQEHNSRISQHEATKQSPEYYVHSDFLEAADFGVPQKRKRVFIIAIQSRMGDGFKSPAITHKEQELIKSQATGIYWNDHGLEAPQSHLNGEAYFDFDGDEEAKPWRTVRDALTEMPPPADSEDKSTNNHWLIPGARIYRGHSGSRLDWPSKTIKAGVHGVPGGENIVLLDDGSYRYFTLRETAKIQGFPDDFVFHGARLHVTRQIGNAVPVNLAEAVGRSLFEQISEHAERNS